MTKLNYKIIFDAFKNDDINAINHLDWLSLLRDGHYSHLTSLPENNYYADYKINVDFECLKGENIPDSDLSSFVYKVNSWASTHKNSYIKFGSMSVNAGNIYFGFRPGANKMQEGRLNFNDILTIDQWNKIDWRKYVSKDLLPLNTNRGFPVSFDALGTVGFKDNYHRLGGLSESLGSLVFLGYQTADKAHASIYPTVDYLEYLAHLDAEAAKPKPFKNPFILLRHYEESTDAGYSVSHNDDDCNKNIFATLEDAQAGVEHYLEYLQDEEGFGDDERPDILICQVVQVARPKKVERKIPLEFIGTTENSIVVNKPEAITDSAPSLTEGELAIIVANDTTLHANIWPVAATAA